MRYSPSSFFFFFSVLPEDEVVGVVEELRAITLCEAGGLESVLALTFTVIGRLSSHCVRFMLPFKHPSFPLTYQIKQSPASL